MSSLRKYLSRPVTNDPGPTGPAACQKFRGKDGPICRDIIPPDAGKRCVYFYAWPKS